MHIHTCAQACTTFILLSFLGPLLWGLQVIYWTCDWEKLRRAKFAAIIMSGSAWNALSEGVARVIGGHHHLTSNNIQYTAFRPHQLAGRCSGKFRCKGTQFGRSRGQVKTLPILISKTLAQRLRDTEKNEQWFWMEMVALESLDPLSNWCGCQFCPQMACQPVWFDNFSVIISVLVKC